MLKTGNLIAAKVYRTYSAEDQKGWIVPYESFQTETALLKFKKEDYEVKILDCFVTALVPCYTVDFNEDDTVKELTFDERFGGQLVIFTIFETNKTLQVRISSKLYEAEEIVLPEEMKQLPGFREKGYCLYST